MKTKQTTFALLLTSMFAFGSFFNAKAQNETYALHAMFIHNFIKYTEWPSNVQQVTVGVLNNSSVMQVLSQRIGASNTNGKVQVKNLKSVEESGTCQVIFVPTSSRGQLAKVLEIAKGKNILVVTEDSEMTKKGAGISFKVVQDKMKFQINQEAIKSSGLKISGSLLALAVN